MNLQNRTIKMMAKVSLILFAHFILFSHYPTQAQENLIITGFQIKTPTFKPYREKGRISFFLNMDASINVELQDKEFNLVRSIEFMGKGMEGENTINLDGKDENEEFIKSGQYIFSITAQANNGTSAIISKDVKIEFEAPMGTEFKPHVTKIEGKPKKKYPSEVPTKFVLKERWWAWCCLSPIAYPIGLALSWSFCIIDLGFGNYKQAKKDLLLPIYTNADIEEDEKKWELFGVFKPIPNYKEYAKIKQGIDEHNAEIDAEIARRNREIDEYNEKAKDSIIINMKLTK